MPEIGSSDQILSAAIVDIHINFKSKAESWKFLILRCVLSGKLWKETQNLLAYKLC